MSPANNISPDGAAAGVGEFKVRRKRARASQQFKSNSHPQKRTIAHCKKEIDLIAAYLAGDLSTAARSEFETHLQACPDCVAFLATYKKTIAITRAFLQSHSPRGLAPRLSLHR